MDMHEKPDAPRPCLNSIPAELKVVPQWVAWKWAPDKTKSRWTKKPVCCANGRVVDCNGSANRCSFGEAASYYERTARVDGIGFVFTEKDSFAGVDLDGCIESATGVLKPWAAEIVRELDSYTEISPSGRGLKIFLRGQLPRKGRNRTGPVEMYSGWRYFTVTGLHLEGTLRQVAERQVQLPELHKRLFPDFSRDGAPTTAAPNLHLSDEEILKRAKRSRNGREFAQLWDGDIAGYHSHSEADLALCGMLASWTGPDEARVERLMGLSVLGQRDKWQKMQDYRERTISIAVWNQRTFFGVADEGDAGMLTRIKQESQDKQEYSGFMNTDDASRRGGVVTPTEHDKQESCIAIAHADNNRDTSCAKECLNLLAHFGLHPTARPTSSSRRCLPMLKLAATISRKAGPQCS